MVETADDQDYHADDDAGKQGDGLQVIRPAEGFKQRVQTHADQDAGDAGRDGQVEAVHVLVVALGVVFFDDVHAAAHEIVEVRVEQVAERQQLVHLGIVRAGLPFADGLARHA